MDADTRAAMTVDATINETERIIDPMAPADEHLDDTEEGDIVEECDSDGRSTGKTTTTDQYTRHDVSSSITGKESEMTNTNGDTTSLEQEESVAAKTTWIDLEFPPLPPRGKFDIASR
ncbi:hypothetical protein BDF19DRAFT_446599 [Syncephalis fuscata]|nr:hypothetical protein BDF19DRAFT_446599 [Syncephalis fuscata]